MDCTYGAVPMQTFAIFSSEDENRSLICLRSFKIRVLGPEIDNTIADTDTVAQKPLPARTIQVTL
jgi:hypothetical protein